MKTFLIFLGRNKAYTAVNILGMSLSLMFVILIGVYNYQELSVNRQLDKRDRIEVMCISDPDGSNACEGLHHVTQKYLRQQFPEIESSCGVAQTIMRIVNGNEYINVKAYLADSTFFTMFNYKLLEGDPRTCLQDENGIVISQSFAHRLFGNANPMGREFEWWQKRRRMHVTGVMQDLDNTLFTKMDVLAKFCFDNNTNGANTDEYAEKKIGLSITGCSVFLLMHPGTTLQGKDKQITDCIHSHWDFFNNKSWPQKAFTTNIAELYLSDLPSNNEVTQRGNATLLNILALAALVILFFAITNYINLTVAQSGYRAREMATQRLFGASRKNVFMHLVMESTLMVLISFVIAVVLAVLLAPTFGNYVDKQLDMTLLYRPIAVIVAIVFIVLIGAVAGVIPAAIISKVKPIEVIKGTFRHQTKMVLSRVFIVIQNIITIAMLSCAAIMLSQTWHLVHAPMGFNTDNIITVEPPTDEIDHFMQDLRSLPCVQLVSASMGTPLDGGNNNTINKGNGMFSMQFFVVDPYFMDIYGLKLKDGSKVQTRHFYFNHLAVQESKSILGVEPYNFLKKNHMFATDSLANYGGEFKDFHIDNILREQQPMMIDVQEKVDYPWIISIKIAGDPVEAYKKIGGIFQADFHQEMTDDDAEFADKAMKDKFSDQVRTSRLVAMFAVIAIIISLLGLIAMSTYFIEQRRKEIAIRKVFGSTDGQVGRCLISSFLSYVVIALVIAVPIVAYTMNDWISQYSYRLSLWWLWIPVAGMFVIAVSYAAVAVQSRKAARQNPSVNLKSE